jgi:poly(A) polymerase
MKLFLAGNSLATYRLMQHYQVFQALFPATAAAMRKDKTRYERLFESAFANSDARLEEGKSVTPVFILAVLLWPAVQQELLRTNSPDTPAIPLLQEAAQHVIDDQVDRIAIPKRFSYPVRELWELQHRFTERRGRRAEMLLSHKRFRAAYDFLVLREESGEDLQGLGQWWTEYQSATPERQAEMQAALLPKTAGGHAKPRRRKVKSRPPRQQKSAD